MGFKLLKCVCIELSEIKLYTKIKILEVQFFEFFLNKFSGHAELPYVFLKRFCYSLAYEIDVLPICHLVVPDWFINHSWELGGDEVISEEIPEERTV